MRRLLWPCKYFKLFHLDRTSPPMRSFLTHSRFLPSLPQQTWHVLTYSDAVSLRGLDLVEMQEAGSWQ